MTRDEKVREARRLRGLGWSAPEIGRELGVSDSTVRNWYLGGDCSKCGAPLDGSAAKKAQVCCHCNQIAHKLRGTGSTNSRALEYMEEPRRFMEIVRDFGITKEHASGMLNRLLRYGLIERPARGLYVRAK